MGYCGDKGILWGIVVAEVCDGVQWWQRCAMEYSGGRDV